MSRFVGNVRWWSNGEIKRALAPLDGVKSVINVSGYDDRDKQGAHYRDYYPSDIDYYMSYYPTDEAKGTNPAKTYPTSSYYILHM